MNDPHVTERESKAAETRLDADLRRTLEPDAATVDRVVRHALATGHGRPRPRIAWPLAAAALLAFAVLSIRLLAPAAPPPSQVASPAASRNAPPASEPAALEISNRGGLVTVTTPAGTKMVFLPSAPQPGGVS